MIGNRGFGAGRPRAHAETTAYLSVAARELTAQIGSSAGVRDVTLTFTVAGQLLVHRVTLTHTRCYFGGLRVWFICPKCEHRIGVVYLGQIAACRKCLELRYPSQSESKLTRSFRKRQQVDNELALRLKNRAYRRPKGMHWRTYEKLLSTLGAAQRDQKAATMGLMLKYSIK